jgi:hypothetical protein
VYGGRSAVAQRNSEYARQADDLYVTPKWVYQRLYDVEPWAEFAWDCAPEGRYDFDFFKDDLTKMVGMDIATNPPFSKADEFVQQALAITQAPRGKVAMLLPYTFDSAKTRRHLWGYPFKKRYNITTRIRWANLEQKKAGPSTNHCWYVWDWNYTGCPTIGWL